MTDLSIPSLQATLSLGKEVAYPDTYDASLLTPVPRRLARDSLGIDEQALPFSGVDFWTGFELSWLNLKGKPVVAILHCAIPVTSPHLVESKSFKLYLNSLNACKFASMDAVKEVLERDLTACAGAPVDITIFLPQHFSSIGMQEFSGTLLDDLDVEITQYQPSPGLLRTQPGEVSETLVSHLLKSNCLITNQPDWASIMIRYSGPQLDHAALLRYLVSFRDHNEFHEQCVERIFSDILRNCAPRQLTVYARYTRRGGLDINPFRSNFEAPPQNIRHARQ